MASTRRLAAILAADVAGYSRLMGADEEGTLERLKATRRELVDPKITEHRGRIVKTTGDGMLVEFASVVDAVRCAVDVQREMAERNADVPAEKRIEFRVGINLGDIIIDEDDIFGDGVNIAARLEAMAEPGGICISGAAHAEVETRLELSFRELGPQTLKNIPRPVNAYAVDVAGGSGGVADPASMKQEIRYCRTADGVRLAYSVVGRGPPLVRSGRWFTHLEYEWEHLAKHFGFVAVLKDLVREFRLLRYDARGNGMSDWEVEKISLDAWVRDLETVVDAAGFERFALLAESQSVSVAIAYAARHPERVSRLILTGGFALGARKRPGANIEQQEAMTTLMRLGWGGEDPAYRQMFTTQFCPDATKEQSDALNEFQRISTSAECAVRQAEVSGNIDVTAMLSEVTAPTLVMHVRGDARVPFEVGRQLAAGISGARFVALPGKNHALLPGEPALARYEEEIRLFLAD
jgi:class 3 adenylate cyclase/pimeloyl-ACP methyl ester carboxylesterase